jgi:hypothetical protein
MASPAEQQQQQQLLLQSDCADFNSYTTCGNQCAEPLACTAVSLPQD